MILYPFPGKQHYEAWKKILNKTPIDIIKEVAKGVCKIAKIFNLDGLAPLHIAGWIGHFELFQYLFENSLEKNPVNNIGESNY